MTEIQKVSESIWSNTEKIFGKKSESNLIIFSISNIAACLNDVIRDFKEYYNLSGLPKEMFFRSLCFIALRQHIKNGSVEPQLSDGFIDIKLSHDPFGEFQKVTIECLKWSTYGNEKEYCNKIDKVITKYSHEANETYLLTFIDGNDGQLDYLTKLKEFVKKSTGFIRFKSEKGYQIGNYNNAFSSIHTKSIIKAGLDSNLTIYHMYLDVRDMPVSIIG